MGLVLRVLVQGKLDQGKSRLGIVWLVQGILLEKGCSECKPSRFRIVTIREKLRSPIIGLTLERSKKAFAELGRGLPVPIYVNYSSMVQPASNSSDSNNPKVSHPYRMVLPDGEVIPARLNGFRQVSINLTPFRDQFGNSWVSIYGPIRNGSGSVVGVLGLAYDSTYWTDLEDHIREVMMIVCIGAVTWLVISSWLILQATKPQS